MWFTSDDFKKHTCGKCRNCGHCGGSGEIECPSCDGEEYTCCYKCMGERTFDCQECGGMSRRSECRECVVMRERVAAEANRLRARDIGRGVTTGTDDLYRTFAVQAWSDGEIATEAT